MAFSSYTAARGGSTSLRLDDGAGLWGVSVIGCAAAMRQKSRWFSVLRVYALAVPVLAALMGAWTGVQAALDPSTSQRGHLLGASLVRATAPAASGCALLLAIVFWAHPLRPWARSGEVRQVFGGLAAAALPGFLAAAAAALLAGLAVAPALDGLPSAGVSVRDFGVGAAFAVVDSALLLTLGSRLLPRLQQTQLSFPAKLALALAVTMPLRASVALLAASFLPA